jgi:ribonuclease G
VPPSILFVDELENHVRWSLKKHKFQRVTLKLHPYVASYLTHGLYSIGLRWRLKYLLRLKIKASSSNAFLEYNFYDEKGDKIFL